LKPWASRQEPKPKYTEPIYFQFYTCEAPHKYHSLVAKLFVLFSLHPS